MIRTSLFAAALLASFPAAAQTVEQAQTAMGMDLAEIPGITVKQTVDTVKKSALLVRTVTGSKAPKRCQTEFATPEAKIEANLKAEGTLKIDWSLIGAIRRDGNFAIELVAKKPDDVRTVFEFPDSEAASDFAEVFEFLRRNCA